MKLFIIALLVILGLGGFYLVAKPAQPSMPNAVTMEKSTNSPDSEMMVKNPNVTESGQYLPFTETVLQEAQSKHRVLFFFANWCPTCAAANQDFAAKIDQLPSDVSLIRVNYNDSDTDEIEKALATKYVITYQHTFVQIDKSGNEIAKWNGGQLSELLANLKN